MPVLKVSLKHSALSSALAQDYETLCKKLKEMSTLGGISGLLGWGEQAITCLSIPSQTPS